MRQRFLTPPWRLISLAVLISALGLPSLPQTATASAPRVTHQITWDSHSLMLDGQRLLIYSGEFHYFRLPSQSAWWDRLQKMKAAGLNAVSIYFDWAYHSSAPGVYDFSGVRDIDTLLSMTERLGLYVIARVGPYMNGEVDAGGIPGWVLTRGGNLRDQTWNGTVAAPQVSPLYEQYSQQWYDHLLPILARHQVSDGGSVLLLSVENEYNQQQGSQQYMQALVTMAHADGITVPLFTNDFWFAGQWSNVVDLYAYDSYPYGFDCCHQWWDMHFHGVDTWESHLRTQLGVKTPMFVSELQGGAYDPWGGRGYPAIAATFNADWLTNLDESAFAQGTDILNTYMYAGGTNWGYMSEPGVYSSYDYGAPLGESGELRPAYYASHLLASFLTTYGSTLAGADAVGPGALATNPAVVVHTRAAPNGQLFVFLRQGDAGPDETTRVSIPLGGKYVTIPQAKNTAITMPGASARILTANVDVGPLHLNYSTSQVFTVVNTADGPYLVLFGPAGTQGETDFVLPTGNLLVTHNAGVTVNKANGELRLNYVHTDAPRMASIQTASGTLHVLIVSSTTAQRFWVDQSMIISGPDLVEDDAGVLKLFGATRRNVTVYGAPVDRSLLIHGRMAALPDAVNGQVLLGNIAGPATITLPQLTTWRFSPGAPEISPAFDDSSWQAADHTSTSNPNVPASDTLLADDYGFHYGFVWYRGHFTPSGTETGLTLQARQSYSVYLNGQYLGSADESLADPPHAYATPRTFTFPPGALHPGSDNVIAVLTESLGHDQGWLGGPVAQSPQGILTATLIGSAAPISWRIQGDVGGETPPDSTRGLMNASGLFGERQGWYVPSFDDSSWQSITTPDLWSARGQSAPVGWYRTHFTLSFPPGEDVPLGLTLPHVSDKAVIWLNGWQVGRYWEQMGPQHEFYLPAGVLNTHGDNVLSVAVWNRGHQGGLTSTPTLNPYQPLQATTLTLGATDQSSSELTYWHTSGNRILDASNRPVRIAAVSWAGMQTSAGVPAGLDKQPLNAILARVHQMGFNAIRLPFSNALVEANPIITAGLTANPELQGRHALDIMDAVVSAAAANGLRVILDDHRSSYGVDPENNGLWYTPRFPESAWIADWKALARRYAGNTAVVGVDLRDEPHTGPPGPWSINTYLHQGATWGPYAGIDNPATDWRLAAERGGDAVLGVNPHLLVFVEGIQQYPDAQMPGGLDSYWWGGILGPARKYPVTLSVPHQLVYSPHEYGPQKYQMDFFGKSMTYRSLAAVWDKHWGYLDHGPGIAHTPIFIGEFGTCGSLAEHCVGDAQPGSQGLWFTYFLRYLAAHPAIGWSYWALNGTNYRGADQPNYIFGSDWHTIRLHQLLDALRDVEVAPPPP